MTKKLTRRKKRDEPFVPIDFQRSVQLRKLSLIDNPMYVLIGIQTLNPYQQRHTVHPRELRRRLGIAWPDGEMPERSFRQALADLERKDAISVDKVDPGYRWFIHIKDDAFFCLTSAADCCRSDDDPPPGGHDVAESGGETSPDRPLKPAQGGAFESAKKQHDRYLNNRGLKEQETEQETAATDRRSADERSVVVSAYALSPEGRSVEVVTEPERSVEVATHHQKSQQESHSYSLDESGQGRPHKLDVAGGIGRDQISAALANSCGDSNFVERYLSKASESEIRELGKIVKRANGAEIRDAIAAMKQQEDRLRSPIPWLIAAIRRKFKPNRGRAWEGVSAEAAPIDVQKAWLNLAIKKGIITHSMNGEDGIQVLHGETWLPISRAMETWSMDWLEQLPDSVKTSLDRLFQVIRAAMTIDSDWLQDLGLKMEGQLLVPQ